MDNFSIHSNENPPTNPLKELKFDLIHNIIYFKSIPSLQSLALVKVASSLWQQEDIQYGIIDFFHIGANKLWFSYYKSGKVLVRKRWLKIEQKVLEKLPQLFLPQCFKEAFKHVIHMMGDQILQFFQFEGRSKGFMLRAKIYLENICWTFQGTVDKINTTLRVIKHPGLSTREKYLVACNYCLVDEIRSLVQLMPIDIVYDFCDVYNWPVYWFFHFRGNSPEVKKIVNRWKPFKRDNLDLLFSRELIDNNGVAVQYIWEKIFDQELKRLILRYSQCTVKGTSCDIFCFFMYRLNQLEETRIVNISERFNVFALLLSSERWLFVFMPFAKYVCHTLWNFDDRVQKLLSFCKEIGLKDKRHKNIYAELSEYCQSHSTGNVNKRRRII